MEKLKFKTNIKCSGCIAAVSPFLNELPEIVKWEVDTDDPQKILTVETSEGGKAEQVINTLQKAGYVAEEL